VALWRTSALARAALALAACGGNRPRRRPWRARRSGPT